MNTNYSLKEKLAPVLPMLNVSYIAKHYFGKSTSWFYQRLNGSIVHGKQIYFKPEEIQTLKSALQDMSERLLALSKLFEVKVN